MVPAASWRLTRLIVRNTAGSLRVSPSLDTGSIPTERMFHFITQGASWNLRPILSMRGKKREFSSNEEQACEAHASHSQENLPPLFSVVFAELRGDFGYSHSRLRNASHTSFLGLLRRGVASVRNNTVSYLPCQGILGQFLTGERLNQVQRGRRRLVSSCEREQATVPAARKDHDTPRTQSQTLRKATLGGSPSNICSGSIGWTMHQASTLDIMGSNPIQSTSSSFKRSVLHSRGSIEA